MTGNRMLAAAAVATAALAGVLLGGVLRDSAPAGAGALPVAAAASFESGFALARDTQAVVVGLQDILRREPRDPRSFALLGLAYQQRARETGDPAYYTKSEDALRRSLELSPDDPIATSGLASLAGARHRFRQSLGLARKARALAPQVARSHGLIGDALVELGRYHEAFRAFDAQARLRPGTSAYARVSYARELLGRPQEAIRAMELAVDAASGQREPLAWAHVQLGKLYWGTGRYVEARREHRLALAVLPGYPHALDALAQAEASLGQLRRAIALERRAVRAVPLPQYVAFLGDLYRVTGREHLARSQYALIGVIDRLLRANGVRTDLETALFRADHGLRPHEALALARAAHRSRPSIDADDVLAWTLERNGRCREARGYSKRALRLGTLDALKFFHRGMIERCLGHRRTAQSWFVRALELNPRFSPIWAPVAETALR